MVADARGGIASIKEAMSDMEDTVGQPAMTSSRQSITPQAIVAPKGSPVAQFGYGLRMGLYPITTALDVLGPIPATPDVVNVTFRNNSGATWLPDEYTAMLTEGSTSLVGVRRHAMLTGDFMSEIPTMVSSAFYSHVMYHRSNLAG